MFTHKLRLIEETPERLARVGDIIPKRGYYGRTLRDITPRTDVVIETELAASDIVAVNLFLFHIQDPDMFERPKYILAQKCLLRSKEGKEHVETLISWKRRQQVAIRDPDPPPTNKWFAVEKILAMD